jgi:hypothetical protein
MWACCALLQSEGQLALLEKTLDAVRADITAKKRDMRQLGRDDEKLRKEIETLKSDLAAVRPSGTCSRTHSSRPHCAAATATNLALQQ